MRPQDLDDWAAFLDREMVTLRGHADPSAATTFAMLDTSYAELQAASTEIKAQAAQIERVASDAEANRRRLAALFQLTTDAILETDDSGVVLDANDSATRLLNVRIDYLRQKPLVLFVAEHDRPLLQKFLSPADPAQPVRQEMSIQPRSAAPVPGLVAAIRVDGIGGEPVRFMWLILTPKR